ncbi:branched-chain amino acid ABC transporter permease [Deferribacterales bacterium RsTz2092]|nr:branched-chain amino acid ABC transporter permease [Deferribacterales bacterium]
MLTLKRTLIALVALIALSLPALASDVWLSCAKIFFIYALLALSQDMVLGRAGVYDMGHALYFGLGGYAFAIALNHGYNMPAAVFIAMLMPAVLAFALSSVAVHLKGDYFLLVSIGYNFIFSRIINNNPFGLTNGPNGIFDISPEPMFGIDIATPVLVYYYSLSALLVVVWLLHNFDRSRYGRALFFTHQDELAALSMGINPRNLRIASFAFSGALAGIAGALFALEYGGVAPEMCTVQESIIIFAIVIVGGQGSLFGTLVGTIIMYVLPELIRGFEQMRYLIFGIVMVAIMVVRPNGLIPIKYGYFPKKYFKRTSDE